MSNELMTSVWKITLPTHAQKLILLKLADWAADDGGSVFPSRNKIAERCDCGKSTVKRTMAALRACGILHLVREGGDGPKDTNEWHLNVPLLEALASKRAKIEGGSDTLEIVWPEDGGEPVEAKGSKMDPMEAEGVQPEPLRGPPTTVKGSASGPQSFTIHQEYPSGAGARASDASASRAPRARAALVVSRNDVQWQAWLDAVDLPTAERIQSAGEFTATARWPTEGERIISIANARVDITARMTGERVE